MKKKLILALALFLLASIALTACDAAETPNVSMPTPEPTPESTPESTPEPTPIATVSSDEDDLLEDASEPEENTAPPREGNLAEDSNESEEGVVPQAETAAGDVKAQMAGSWIGYAFNPDNATLMHLFAEGRWESPGPLPTDMSIGGSFVIQSEEGGIYHLRLIIGHTSEHPASIHIEIGSEFPEFGGFKYDAQNDRLGMEVPAEGNVFQTVWLTRG